jgi:hypothetical protein
MRRGRLALLVFGMAVAGSQAGHLVAYQLRFGAAARQLEGAGAHAYFPALAKTAIGVAALAALASLAVVGAARLASGRRIERESAPAALRLLALLFTVQLAVFTAQETVEAALGGAHMATAGDLLLWGTAGQLPVALLSAFALRWLAARLEPALRALAPLGVACRPLVPAVRPRPPAGAVAVFAARGGVDAFTRRGPPSF